MRQELVDQGEHALVRRKLIRFGPLSVAVGAVFANRGGDVGRQLPVAATAGPLAGAGALVTAAVVDGVGAVVCGFRHPKRVQHAA